MLDYLIYLLTFVIGSILGLLYSYKLHGEPYVADGSLNIKMCIISMVLSWEKDQVMEEKRQLLV